MKFLQQLVEKFIFEILIFASAFPLLFAYISQFIFGYEPCILCIYQRIPFLIILLLCIAQKKFIKSQNETSRKIKKIILIICAALLASNILIATYHSAVEQKLVKPTYCTADEIQPSNLEEMKRQILSAKIARCDEPKFFFLHLSMANWNVIYCLFLLVGIVKFYKRKSDSL